MKALNSVLLAACLSISGAAIAQTCAGNLKEGADYAKMSVAKSDSLAQQMNKDIIIEFFSYACIHCATLSPQVERLVQSSPDVKGQIVYMPVVFRPDWEVAARLYFALDSLQLATYENNSKVFKAVHTDKKRILTDEKEMEKFVKETFGDKAPNVLEQMKGFNVANKIAQSKKLAAKYQVDSTPLFVVDKVKGEQFKVDGSIAKTADKLIATVGEFAKTSCK